MENEIVLPSQPRVVKEEKVTGIYEIDGLHPGYGHTLGNSLRRIILSSLLGSAISSVKIDGVDHEFSIMDGVKEDVITILLNLRKVRIKMLTDEPQVAYIKSKGEGVIKAGDINVPGQVEILNPDLVIATVVDKKSSINAELTILKGLGYVSKEVIQKDRVSIGTIALDCSFSPVRRVSYEVEDMRVGDRTDFNRLKIFIETDGTITPREILEKSIEIMIKQLKAIIGFQEEEIKLSPEEVAIEKEGIEELGDVMKEDDVDKELLKTRIESLNLSTRTENALAEASIRTIGGLIKKKEENILELDGLGKKGLDEIKDMLKKNKLELRSE